MRRAALLAQLDEMVRQKATPFNGLRSCEPECLQRLGCRKKKASGKCKVSAVCYVRQQYRIKPCARGDEVLITQGAVAVTWLRTPGIEASRQDLPAKRRGAVCERGGCCPLLSRPSAV